MGSDSKNKRLAKNTIYLYIRMLFAVCINLYTSRLVLEYLGVEDFGVYNVVGGIVSLMMFVNTAMSGATSRFITFCLGKNDVLELKATISSAIQVHAIIALFILLIGESVGLWFVNSQLNIPTESMYAANWVYQFSLFASVVAILQVPFNASVLSYEKMDVFAIIEILNVILKCVIVFCLVWFPDRLIAYGGLTLLISVIISLLYAIYCIKRLDGFGFSCKNHKAIVKEMTVFAACDLYGNGTFAVRQQGINILINQYFGVTFNAAGGVATQASGIISTFMNNVLSAFRPQIVKEYSVGNIARMSKLMFSECEILILLIGLIFVPLFINMDFVMQLWLKNVPPYAVIFCKILLVCNALSVVTQIVQDGIFATGKVKRFSFIAGNLNIVCLFLTYIFFLLGFDAQYAYYAMLICIICQTFVNSYLLNRLIDKLDMKRYLQNTIKPFIIVGVSYLIVSQCTTSLAGCNKAFTSLVINTIFITISVLVLYTNYRTFIVSILKRKMKR
ncbi:polysaccharide biosynthesis protein [Segatella copri]|uniref:lipopolysaccharide biosynthesis protein n=1 Tax=Segatella copri TaxID=165179 RepID=UPI001C45F2D5|nr:polysaccharide biosynthesis protein [Segatella copri]MBW0032649.1 polysaccharide biosynthesis protein [Segatella copri]